MSYELYITPEKPKYNPTNGQFLKGHEPANKGRKWSEWMSKDGVKRASKGWENLSKFRPTKRAETAGRRKRPCIGIDNDGKWHYFPYINKAAEVLGIASENIRNVCAKRRHHAGGWRFFYEEDNEWISVKDNPTKGLLVKKSDRKKTIIFTRQNLKRNGYRSAGRGSMIILYDERTTRSEKMEHNANLLGFIFQEARKEVTNGL